MLESLKEAPEDVWQLIKDWPLALQFDLPEDSVVVVAGAYRGLVMELLRHLYPTCKLWGFEPQEWAAHDAAERLRKFDPRVPWSILPYGLGVEDATLQLGEWHTDAASFIHTGPGSREQGSG